MQDYVPVGDAKYANGFYKYHDCVAPFCYDPTSDEDGAVDADTVRDQFLKLRRLVENHMRVAIEGRYYHQREQSNEEQMQWC